MKQKIIRKIRRIGIEKRTGRMRIERKRIEKKKQKNKNRKKKH